MSVEFIIITLIALFLVFRFQNRQEKTRIEASQAKEQGSQFMADNEKKEGVIRTQSGLQYKVIHKSENAESPNARDQVKVHYHGTLINGTVFDSSVDRGEPISFGLNQVIAGWTEGLQLMSVGDKFRLFIPSELAYGERKAGIIPAGSTLIFDVELLGIERA